MAILLTALPVRADDPSADSFGTARLFEEEIVAENVMGVREQAGALPLADRFNRLRSWVLPPHRPETIRLFATLTPCELVSSTEGKHPRDLARLRTAAERGERRVPTGGNLVSPVFDLIEAARELSRLDDLRAEVLARPVTGEIAQRGQLSLLALIEMARRDEQAASQWADQLSARLATGSSPRLIDRMPETLFAWAAAEQGMLLMEAERVLVPIWENQIIKLKHAGPGEWDRLISNMLGWVRHSKTYSQSGQPFQSQPPLASWHTATRRHVWSPSAGVPAGHWQRDGGEMICLARHDDEYLLFGTPLRGNFTVESSCSGFGYRDCHLFVAGSYVDPVYTLNRVTMGGLFSFQPDVPMNPKLSHIEDYARYRVEVRDGLCHRFINGRLIHTQTLSAEPDPWVSVRVPNYGLGHVRDVRITGSPIIPKSIVLSELKAPAYSKPLPPGLPHRPINQLDGWMPWHDELWDAKLQSWHVESDESGQSVIVGRRDEALAGTTAERLLRYHWPLVWDSEVSYEFFYRAGESIAHPSIGRLAFLLEGNGLKCHQITTGFWDRSGLDPLDATPVTDGTAPATLKPDAWNTAALRLQGDTVEILLNGQTIGRQLLEPTNDRTFGVYYDSGETELRVRNVVLRGDWPKTLPPVDQQELRGTHADEYDVARDALPDKFEIDFTQTTLPDISRQFYTMLGNNPAVVDLRPEGLFMTAQATVGKYAATSIGARLQIEGDFDIISHYEDLELNVPEQGFCGIYQCHLFSQPQPKHFNIIRSNGQYTNHPRRSVIQAEIYNLSTNRQGASYPHIATDESNAGRMRMVRRGKTLTYLAAPFDSESFRVLHSEEVTDEPLHANDLQLRLSAYSQAGTESSVSVIWKSLHVRAGKITNLKAASLPAIPRVLPPPRDPPKAR